MKIRAAQIEDYKFFPEVEQDAAQVFRSFGLDKVADMPPTPAAYYIAQHSSLKAYLAEEGTGIMGFIVGYPLDDAMYLKEVSVRQTASGKGIGRALINKFIEETGTKNIILTTFRNIPFNGPFYHKIGFEEFVPDKDTYPELLKIRESEIENGLDILPRVCMKLEKKR